MSGGVDSAVAAYLCLRAGHRVAGVTMLLNDDPSGEFAAAAARVAATLGISHQVVDLRSAFDSAVVERFCADYASGLTPNPCVLCNEYLKFGALLDLALADGADFLATGHYARLAAAPSGRLTLRTAADDRKDQTYYLYRLTQDQLRRSLFPLGDLSKDQVRAIALAAGLPVAERPESQDLCFVARGEHPALVAARRPEALTPGPVLDLEGRRIGTHGGLATVTVGQRKGLGTGGGRALYVVAIDPARNAVTVGPAAAAAAHGAHLADCRWMAVNELGSTTGAEVKVRYASPRALSEVRPGAAAGLAEVRFVQAQHGVSPGQAAVFYTGDLLLGGGTIMGPIIG